MDYLRNTHDLTLPDWGPYTKKYIGISHVSDKKEGFRFDLSVFPGFYRRKVDVPNVMWESGYHPWDASADLNYFVHRHELEWKDKVYCDISFSEITPNSRLIRCDCVNNVDQHQNIILHYMASMNFPSHYSHAKEFLQPDRAIVPDGGIWVDALDYDELHFAVKRADDHLVPDGYFRAEVRDHHFVNGSGIGQGFGRDKGDEVTYRFSLHKKIKNAVIVFRFRLKEANKALFIARGLINETILFDGGETFQTKVIPIGSLEEGEYVLKLSSLGAGSLELDGFAVIEQEDEIFFEPVDWEHIPEMISGPIKNSLILKYKDIEHYYGVLWDFDQYEIREFYHDELDRFMRHNVHHHVNSTFKGDGEGHFTNVFLRPIPMKPNSSRTIYGMVCHGNLKEVEDMLINFNSKKDSYIRMGESIASRLEDHDVIPSGEPYLFSQKRLAATTLTNVVYPVYVKKSYIKHNTPGRWWDSLYTWDSGFIGLGLLELDTNRAVECLNAYLTEPGDTQAAFIHHGSPVPVQHYLYLELWNKTQSKELLAYFYPRLRQYYHFLAGHAYGSTTRRLASNLIQTWDYFYNSGGWDDYPPQVYVHKSHLQKKAAAVSNTSHCIRIAKILRMAALELGGLAEDVSQYDSDISLFSEALQKYSWDKDAGYFGYVYHNEEGTPIDILRYKTGDNYNMGLDGAYPLVAGICSPEQERGLLEYLQSGQRLWSKIGLSTVDQSAPYYQDDGYWNGAVWFPHQWFYWKTMLDLGEGAFAQKIAKTALNLWKKEVETSYNCFEHFLIESGRGAGWHHFGGLSNPILSWFGAYFRPGRLTCGFDTWIMKKQFNENNTSLLARLKSFGKPNHCFTINATMNPNFKYIVKLNQKEIPFHMVETGMLEINLNHNHTEMLLTIEKAHK
ncbi:hypothetical protein BABA_21436 [Neobacillus bataviensis LMG 21833]|uniref:Mannosylglycerate hydrolase MGH1-like glycoside hydrolase domain-containing protein n=1 Tax=Neobacillus bataviensis LMG 21833 TaxID=1117379 RepID=K6C275_9BACI|nr:trehalase family glycosidase [Neobacillus bataviensis]EKN65250.1 hypothetical protein BABA_21436 [Neobacillus bataviensis LMG 21833]